MARPLPVNLLLAGTGAVLLISGIGGKSIGDVLKGDFGNIEVKKPNIGEQTPQGVAGGTGGTEGTGVTGGTAAEASATSAGVGGGQQAPPPSTFSRSSNFAPSPTTFNQGRHSAPEQEAIARILLAEGIHNPTIRQIEHAREQYHKGTRVVYPSGSANAGAQEFEGGLPVV